MISKNPTSGPPLTKKYEWLNINQEEEGFRIHVHAAFNDQIPAYAVRYEIYDPGGCVYRAGYKQVRSPSTVLAAEVIAIKEGILAWPNHKKGKVGVLLDSLDALYALSTELHYEGLEEYVIAEDKNTLLNSAILGVWYCQRKNLAQLAIRSSHSHDWVGDDIPGHIMSLAQN